MKGDFTRDTFDPALGFTRVLMQQGRVQLDADWNEQGAILTHSLRALSRDLIGPFGGPQDAFGFGVSLGDDKRIRIGKGIYYVDGIRCEASGDLAFDEQPFFWGEEEPELEKDRSYLFYLDVWERHFTYLDQRSAATDPTIREVALLGPDTATRAQLVWQVRCVDLSNIEKKSLPDIDNPDETAEFDVTKISPKNAHNALRLALDPPNADFAPRLSAFTGAAPASTDPCVVSPDARYRGPENQLYRIEIHDEGDIENALPEDTRARTTEAGRRRNARRARGAAPGSPTFKWSRENASVVFPILSDEEPSSDGIVRATLAHLGRDPRFGLAVKDWVEWVDDNVILSGRPGDLLQVLNVDVASRRVTLKLPEKPTTRFGGVNRLLRRWDQKEKKGSALQSGAIPIIEEHEFALEQGIFIKFQQRGARYRSGDYWLIPARTATGNVEWPSDDGGAASLPPRGIVHHRAPLFLRSAKNTQASDLRWKFQRLAAP